MPRRPQESKVFHRTVRRTPGDGAAAGAMLRPVPPGGDVWAAVLDMTPSASDAALPKWSAGRHCIGSSRRRDPDVPANYQPFGARSILRRYSDAWLSTNARRRGGETSARYPRRRPSAAFAVSRRHLRAQRSAPQAADGARCPPLVLRLSRPVPYAPGTVRSVTLLNVGPKLFVDVTAEIPIAVYEDGMGPDPARVAGVDLGIIHPYAVAAPAAALLVSGRAIRAEHRLHLAEKKARSRALASRAPKRGQAGSRRWRKYRAKTRRLEGRHQRRVAQATHEAARAVVDFAVKERIGTLVVGDPRGLLAKDAGKRQNLAVRNWRPREMIAASGRQGCPGRHRCRVGR